MSNNQDLYTLVARHIADNPIDRYAAECVIWCIVSLCDGFTSEEKFEALKNAWNPFMGQRYRKLPYRDFLEGEYWKTVRDYVLETRGRCCALCDETNRLNVHHKTYEHHGEEHRHLGDLIVLCRPCHAKFHDKLADPEDR